MHRSFTDIINTWPTAEEFARDLQITGVRARVWRARNIIPAGYWRDVVWFARRRRIDGITLELLARIAQQRIAEAGAPEGAGATTL